MRCYVEPVFAFLKHRSDEGVLDSLRRYTRDTLLWTFVMVLAALVWIVIDDGPRDARSVVLLAGAVAVGYWQWRWTFGAISGQAGTQPGWQAALGLVAVLGLVALAAFSIKGGALWAIAAGVAAHDVVVGRGITRPWRFGSVVFLATGLVVACGLLAAGEEGINVVRAGAAGALLALLMFYAELMMLRQWNLAMELERARRDAAELATTRERLRLSEDLHDILGHALEVVALKAELANRLRTVDQDRAGAELAEVERLARGALHDVRELARGRRSTELAAELTGARKLLESAGIGWTLVGDPATIDGPASELLGRVVREAMTNLLRHANASRCAVTLAGTAGRATLRVVNDGVAPMPRPGLAGTGLAGLERRVTEAGGRFSAGQREDPTEFEVFAEVPR